MPLSFWPNAHRKRNRAGALGQGLAEGDDFLRLVTQSVVECFGIIALPHHQSHAGNAMACKPAFRCNSTTGAHTFSSATTSFLIVVVAAAAAAVVVVVFKFFSIFFLN